MKLNPIKTSFLLGVFALSLTHANGATINLASTMDSAGFISESSFTGSFAQISRGDGGAGDADAAYLIADFGNPGAAPLGSNIDVFPSEAAFAVGSLTFDDSGLTGSGVEIVAIDSIDLTSLTTLDISPAELLTWLNAPSSFTFGALDAADQITFTDGLLTSIDLSIDAAINLDLTFLGSQNNAFDGTFSISGSDLSLQINDTEVFTNLPTPIPFPVDTIPTNFVIDLQGTVGAVVPEPSVAFMVFLGLASFVSGRRRRPRS
ncbi:MAG: PEP-CTERM sorting domain-containing protein [Verrucomicrobiota bacterium]